MKLPDSPDSYVYRDVLLAIAHEERIDRTRSAIKFRQLCEADFWAYCRFASSLRDYKITDKSSSYFGKLWIEHPFLFERCREIQEDAAAGIDGALYSWARGHFKTTLITQHLMAWELLQNPGLTNAIITFKEDKTGTAMLEEGIKKEFETNEMLLAHWPDVLWLPTEKPDLWSANRINVKRPPGPREPSVSVHSLDAMPTSQHFDRIYPDDLVTQGTVETEQAMEKCLRMMRRMVALRKVHGTIERHVCTIWDDNDPNMRQLREGVYVKRSHHPAVLPPDAEVRDFESFARALRSGEYSTNLLSVEEVIRLRKKMGAYEFSCQYQGNPVAKGDQFFNPSWFRYYRNMPEKERVGKDVHVVIDPAGGNQGGDFTSIRVCGFGYDGIRYQLDLWRERFGLVQSIDLVLGPDPDEETELTTWHGPRVWDGREWIPVGVAQKWRPITIWLECYGDNGWFDAFKDAMERKRYRVKLKKLPAIKRSKESRIALLQPAYESGNNLYPYSGFGHGSKNDKRDTMHQYYNDEFCKWFPAAKRMHDDDLDSDAWFEQPEVKGRLIKFPRREEATTARQDPFAGKTARDFNNSTRAVSFWGR